MRRCKVCKSPFKPTFNSLQPTCGKTRCAIEWGRMLAEKSRKKETRTLRREANERDLSWWKRVGGDYNLHGGNAAYWLHRWIVRVRDAHQPCIMCGANQPCGGHFDACHYRTRGAAGHLRFEPDAIHKGCHYCNSNTSGDTGALYRANLVNRIGEARAMELDNDNTTRKWTIDECREIRDRYKALCKAAESQQKASA